VSTALLDAPATPASLDPAAVPRTSSGWRRVWRGPESDPAWARPALFALLGTTFVLYVWNLGASGWANSYYAMAVQAGTKSWKAMFFGSLDAGNSITVDKAPASLWVMEASARVFGVNSWSILVPQALEGVASVALLYATVKRWFSAPAALIAGAVMALTPVAALMFRYDNPDALLTLTMVAGAYALTRAMERGQTSWLFMAFACVGVGFLAKELQALLVIPAFGLTYLLFGPPKLGLRVGQLCAAAGVFLVTAFWWVVVVMMWPAASRPYIGGSQNNSLWNVLFGYNGFGRLSGNETGSVGGGPQGTAGRWGPTGVFRLFNQSFGGEASWLIPAAVIVLVAGLLFTWRMPRTDRTRAALVMWGGWLVVTAGAFSLGQGIIHPYYQIALAPPIGALIGIGATRLWAGRGHPAAMAALVVAFGATVYWSYRLLDRTPNWHPVLRTLVVVGGVAGIVLLLASATPALRKGALAIAIGALVIALAGPAAYTLSTVDSAHVGPIPVSGPAQTQGFPGGGGGPRAFGGFGRNGGFPGFGGNRNGFPQFGGSSGPPTGFGGGFAGRGGGNGGNGGGLFGTSTPPSELTNLLKQDASSYRWVAATIGANNAAGYQLASGESVMAIGGFNGTDPSPTLEQFEAYVIAHKIHYFISGGGLDGGGFRGGGFGGGPTQSSTTSEISQWVADNFTAQTVGGVTIYDLTTSTG
jgi:4-amino-4-deoxy-L-arabinose transferase-like glycosyltransferase